MKNARSAAVVYINSIRHEISGEHAFMMLADYLRYSASLTGTKIVCAEGDCGACSVLKASYFGHRSSEFETINSCIVMMAQLDGCYIVTVEGLKTGKEISPVQEAMVNSHAAQCGYCTPGFAIAISSCVAKGKCTEQEVKNCLTGNLCRCTGYSPLIEAALRVKKEDLPSLEGFYQSPEKEQDLKAATHLPLRISHGTQIFLAPTTMKDAVKLRKAYPSARIIASGTDVGVFINKGKVDERLFISLHLIDDLYKIRQTKSRIHVGARATLSEVRRACEPSIPEFSHLLNIFASPQIKNTGTLVGNVANGSPIGDTLPFLMVSNSIVHTQHSRGAREIPLEEFYVGYRALDLKADEIISGVSFDIPKANEVLKLYKVSQRKDLDIATIGCAFSIRQAKGHITSAKIALGGVGETVLRLTEVEDFLRGQVLSDRLIDEAAAMIQQAIHPLSDLRGTGAYRRILIDGYFRKYFEESFAGALS